MSEVTHVPPMGGDPASDVSRLLGVEGLAVTRVEVDGAGARVVHVVTADELAAACPACGVFSTAAKGWVQTQGPGKVAFVHVRTSARACAGRAAWCRRPAAMLSQPAMRSRLSAMLRQVAMMRGACPVRTWDSSSPYVLSRTQ